MTTAVAIVVQRYGAEIVGGAELLTRQVAGQLHQVLGWQVDVYTTTAKDYRTWANAYQPGTTVDDGVRVHRFNSLWPRAAFFGAFDRLAQPWLGRFRRRRWARPLAFMLEWLWIVLQGPYCPSLIRQLAKDEGRYQKIIFVTYLYYPTLAGVRRFGHKALLVPLAHEEPPLHFLSVERMLLAVRSMLTNTKPEADLIKGLLGAKVRVPIDQAGMGFDEERYVPRAAGNTSAQRPYVLYLGRISAGKGVAQLVAWFDQVRLLPGLGNLRLVLAGHREDTVTIPPGAAFDYRGFVSEEEKLALMRDAAAVINPSAHESLSLIVIEALALKVPVLVNAHCEVLRYYTEEVPTAFAFRDYESFAAALKLVLDTPWASVARQQDLETARGWALKMFSWKQILKVYERQVLAL